MKTRAHCFTQTDGFCDYQILKGQHIKLQNKCKFIHNKIIVI